MKNQNKTEPVDFKIIQRRLYDQLLWAGVYVLSATFAFYTLVAIINFSYSSGLYWKISENRLKSHRHHAVQYQLFNAKKLATADVIIIGDTPFIDQLKNTDIAEDAEFINLPGMSLVNLMVTLTALENSEKTATKVIIFNAPWQWSSSRAGLLGGAQDTNFYNRRGKFDLKRNKLKLSLIFIEQVIKQPSTPYSDDQFKRPSTLANVTFQYPPVSPAKKTYHNNTMRMLKKYETVTWVNDSTSLPEDVSYDFETQWKKNMSVDSQFIEVGTIEDITSLVK